MADGTRQSHRSVKPFANFADQGEGRCDTSMAACPRSDRNQAIRTFFNGFASKTVIDDIMQRNAAPAMHRCI